MKKGEIAWVYIVAMIIALIVLIIIIVLAAKSRQGIGGIMQDIIDLFR